MDQFLPTKYADLVCFCSHKGKDRAAGFTYDDKLNFFVCGACRKVAPVAFDNVFRKECEGCDKEYIVGRHPDKYGLCGTCAGSIQVRPRRARPRD